MNNKVKEILRENVHQHEYPINPEEIFVGALAKVKQEKKDRKRYFFGFLLFFGLAVTAKLQFSTLNTNFDFQGNETEAFIGEIIEDTNTKNILPEEDLEPQVSSSSSIVEDVKEEKETQVNFSIAQTSIAKEKVNSPTKNITDNKSIESKAVKETKIINQNSQLKKQESTVAKPIINSIIPTVSSIKNLRKAKEEIVEKPVEEGSRTKESLLSKSKEKIAAVEKESVNELSQIEFQNLIDISMLKLIYPGLIEVKERGLDIKAGMDEQLVQVEPREAKSKFALSLIGSYGLYQKTYTAKEEQYLEYVNARNNAETDLEILSTKLILSYKLNDYIQLSSGLKFQQINEEFAWDGSYTINELGEQIDLTQDNLVGIPFYQNVDRDLVNYNKHQLLSIPVLVGITKEMNALTVGLHAGPFFNVYTNSEGLSLNQELLPNLIEVSGTSFSLGIETNVELGYSMNRSTDLLLDVSLQRLQSQDQFLNATFNSLSIGLGIRKSL